MFRGIGSGIGMRPRTKAILAVAALAVLATLVVLSEEPSLPGLPETCTSKGIDPSQMKEGTCYSGGSKLVVVDTGDALRLETLEARLDGYRVTASLSGPAGTVRARGKFVVFELAITDRAAYSAVLGKDQLVLLLEHPYGEDLEVERGYEPHSFLARKRLIRPGETVHGTVVFRLPPAEVAKVAEHGNLDIANFGIRGDAFEPEAVLSQSEAGVMRTYTQPEQ